MGRKSEVSPLTPTAIPNTGTASMSTSEGGKPNYLALFLTSLIFLGPLGLLAWYLLMRSVVTPEVDRGEVRELLSRDVRPMDRLVWSPDGAGLATCSRHG